MLAIAFLAAQISGSAQICTEHTFLGDQPAEGDPGWHEEAQGLAHDQDYWYVTQNPAFLRPIFGGPVLGGGPRLWRIPVTHNLADGVDCGDGGVSCRRLFDTALFARGYNHYGDPDFYEFNGRGYIVVPIEVESDDPHPAMAFFRADETLAFVAMAPVPLAYQNKAGWVAVDPDGFLISSSSPLAHEFNRFSVDWTALTSPTGVELSILTFDQHIQVQDEAGLPFEFQHPQGGEHSDDGQLLYFSNGFIKDPGPSWGVHVFRTRPGSGSECGADASCIVARMIESSHNGSGGFAFKFDSTFPFYEEPEGLTAWDLDADGRAPGLGGQLHVILLDNDEFSDDDVYVKHYRLSFNDAVAPSITCPLDTVAECSIHTGVPPSDPQLSSFFSSVTAIDACDGHPAISSSAAPLFGLGTTPVTFTATDHTGNASSCQSHVTVVDSLAPALTCPPPTAVECTSAGGISAADAALAPFFHGAVANDVCDAGPILSSNAPGFLPLGTTPVTFTARDASLNVSSCGSAVTVADTGAPQIAVVLSPSILWPPSHRLVAIQATVAVTDRCDPLATFQLVSITSNEPDDGLGDGNDG